MNFIGNSGGGASANLDAGADRFLSVPTLTGNNGGILPYGTVSGTVNGTNLPPTTVSEQYCSLLGLRELARRRRTERHRQVDRQRGLAANKTITALLLAVGRLVAGFTLTVTSGGLAATGHQHRSSAAPWRSAPARASSRRHRGHHDINSPSDHGQWRPHGRQPQRPTAVPAPHLILDNPSTYTGGTILGGGVLQVGGGSVLGTGTVSLPRGPSSPSPRPRSTTP